MEKNTSTTPLWKELNNKRTQGVWRQGYTLMTTNTNRWSKEDIKRNDLTENKILFTNFNLEDEGRGRMKVAVFESNPADTLYTAMAVNNLASLAEALQSVINDLPFQPTQGTYDKIEKALKQIS